MICLDANGAKGALFIYNSLLSLNQDYMSQSPLRFRLESAAERRTWQDTKSTGN